MAPRPHAVHPAAEREVARALTYHLRKAGASTAAALAEAIDVAAARASDDPLASPILCEARRETVRSRRVPGFRYRLLFVVRASRVLFVALAHTSRRPKYWIHRLR